MLYDLESALHIIKSTMHHHKKSEYFPYFFIVGAGISVPEIPTASKIVDICKETVRTIDPELFVQYDKKSKDLSNDGMRYYSSWIEYAYPNRIDRSNLFKSFCNKAKISSANLMLAQILQSNAFANTVFTPNFDDSIKKALELMGTENFFCAENSMDNLVVSNQTKDIQVVHVHGTFAFYDCANLEKEIDSIASRSGTISSSQLLSTFLANQAPIVVGYSGWENDVIMRCLKERLAYPTPLQYIWICHNKQSYQGLPDWIKESDNVIFVVPEANRDDSSEIYDNLSWDSSSANDSIDAATFFKQIISSFKLTAPLIFTDPYSYYSEKIHSILPENEDVLHLRHWAQRLKTIENDNVFENLVQKLEASCIAKNYDEANSVLAEMSKLSVNEANVDFVCTSLIKEFIGDEDSNSSLEPRLKFRFAALDFIKNNLSPQSNVPNLISTLRSILFLRFRYSEKEKALDLIDKVIELSHADYRLLIIELAALGMKSDFADKEEKREILYDILARVPEGIQKSEFIFIKYRVLSELGKISSPDDAVEFIEEAEQLSERLDNESYRISLCRTKAKILPILTNEVVKEKWLGEIIETISSPRKDVALDLYVEIVVNLSGLSDDAILKYSSRSRIEAIIAELLSEYSIDPSSYRSAFYYCKCCVLLERVAASKTTLAGLYSRFIKDMLSFPCIPEEHKKLLFAVAQKYMLLPEEFASAALKVETIAELKKNDCTRDIYYQLLYFADSKGLIKEFPQFNDDINYHNEKREKLTEGYDQYCKGNHDHAETLFSELMSCEVSSVANAAINNLAYMVRRKETKRQYSFEELIKKKTDLDGFSLVNILLYCTTGGKTDSDMFLKAKTEIEKISKEEREAICAWWGNVEIVGEEESKLALSLIGSN